MITPAITVEQTSVPAEHLMLMQEQRAYLLLQKSRRLDITIARVSVTTYNPEGGGIKI
jgi:hypothetical protein